jgi:hypothetical protein
MAEQHLETSIHRIHQNGFFGRPEGRLCVLRTFRPIKTTFKLFRRGRFFRRSLCRKCVRIALRVLETYLQQSRFLIRPSGKLWFLRAICTIETSLNRLRPSRFFRCPGSKKWIRMTFRYLKTSFCRLYQNHYLRRLDDKFSGPFAYLTQLFREFFLIVFFNSKNLENAF